MHVLKKVLLSIAVALGVFGGLLGIMASRFQSVIRPNVSIGLIDVSGLTKDEAAKKLRLWWDQARRTEITLTCSQLRTQLAPMSLTKLGISVDDAASVDQLPMDEFWDSAQRAVGLQDAPKKKFEVVYRFETKALSSLERDVKEQAAVKRPARAFLKGGSVVLEPELVGLTLDKEQVHPKIMEVWPASTTVELPLKVAEKKVSDDALAQITDIVSTFSTRFPTSKVTRCHNIKLASQKLNGVVLLPGERLSFNGTVGKRTVEGGFQVAGVYKNGKHDFDIGGGICQVSTTLYNASVFANLGIRERSNHSMPVAYVPLGRDATVDYGSHDLVIENTYSTPIAISSQYAPGKLSFCILGKKDPSLKIAVESEGRKTFPAKVEYVNDPTLGPGKQKVVDKGGIGGSVTTIKIIYRDGLEVSREVLARSFYRGGTRIIARGTGKGPSTVNAQSPTTTGGGQ